MDIIDKISLMSFRFDIPNLSLGGHAGLGVSNYAYEKGAKLPVTRLAVKIHTKAGLEGCYVVNWGSTLSTYGQMQMLAPHFLGRNPEERVALYDDMKRELRAYDRMGYGPYDIALWDLAGKKYQASVSTLLGGYRTHLLAYASTHHAQENAGGLDSPQAFANFAKACQEQGITGFKIHGWHNGDVKREIAAAHAVRAAVGPDMALMNDPACQLRAWNDALRLGHALDEAHYLWYEDPYRDGSAAVMGHKRLREKLQTPLMLTEYTRGVEASVNVALADACDMLHIDPEYDMGITGALKIAHFAESVGLDVQVHACGPAQRHLISALRNTMFYEMALVGPNMPNLVPPVYTCGYHDDLEAIGPDGTVPVPTKPGLGVDYDWDYIKAHLIDQHDYTLD